MAIPLLARRRERKNAELATTISDAVEKALSPAVAQAASQVSGATYPVPMLNPSSPFTQSAGFGEGYQALPRMNGTFDSGFGPASPLWPDPLDPLNENGRAGPRRYQYPVSTNINLNDRLMPWGVLTRLATDCDIISRCCELVQDALVGLDWSWGFSPQIIQQIMQESNLTNTAKANALARDKYGDELARIQQFWEYPDKRSGFNFSQFLNQMIWAALVWDGIPMYPSYTLGGDLLSISQIDTTTIKRLLDNQGFIPQPPNPAYQQILYGFPRGEFQAENVDEDGKIPNGFRNDQLAYYLRRPRPHTPYGFSAVEECVNIATLYQARQRWMHSEYTFGMIPRMLIEVAGTDTWTPEQLGYYQQILNDQLSGQIERRQQALLLRPGMTATQLDMLESTYQSTYDEYIILQIGAKFGVPQSQLGIQMRSSIGGAGQTKGQSDQSETFATDALKNFLIDCINDMARRFMGVGPEITMTCTGNSDEDDNLQRAQADASDVGAGIRTRNEIRAERGIPLMDEPEADQLAITTGTGVSFLSGQLAAQEAGQQMAAQMAANGQVPGQPNEGGPNGSNGSDNADDGREPSNSGTGPAQGQAAGNSKSGGSNGNNSGSGRSSAKPSSSSEPVNAEPTAAQKSIEDELGEFVRFASKRVGRQWRPFVFKSIDEGVAAQLNELGSSGDVEVVKEALSLMKRDDTPSKAEDTERLMTYWAEGKGRLKLAWGTDGDFDRCRVELGKYVDPDELDGLCANLHHRATGFWPGHAPGESESHGHSKKSTYDEYDTVKSEVAGGELVNELHDKLVSHYSPKIARAMHDNVDGIEDAIESARLTTPKASAAKAAGDGTDTGMSDAASQAAQAAVAANISFDSDRIISVLQSLYGDSGLAGAGVAAQQLGQSGEEIAAAGGDFANMLPSINWSTWQPGDAQTAELVANGGLKTLLDNANVTVQGMTDSALERMGNVLAEGIAAGDSNQTIASAMRDIVSDPKRAMLISRTEVSRAMSQSTLDSFATNNIEQWTWNPTDGACPICLSNAANGPYPVGGGPTFPAHPSDRCDPRAVLDIDS